MPSLTQKRAEAENGVKNGKALYKLMNNAMIGKNMEELRLASNKKDYLKWTLKPSSTSQKIFHNGLVA